MAVDSMMNVSLSSVEDSIDDLEDQVIASIKSQNVWIAQNTVRIIRLDAAAAAIIEDWDSLIADGFSVAAGKYATIDTGNTTALFSAGLNQYALNNFLVDTFDAGVKNSNWTVSNDTFTVQRDIVKNGLYSLKGASDGATAGLYNACGAFASGQILSAWVRIADITKDITFCWSTADGSFSAKGGLRIDNSKFIAYAAAGGTDFVAVPVNNTWYRFELEATGATEFKARIYDADNVFIEEQTEDVMADSAGISIYGGINTDWWADDVSYDYGAKVASPKVIVSNLLATETSDITKVMLYCDADLSETGTSITFDIDLDNDSDYDLTAQAVNEIIDTSAAGVTGKHPRIKINVVSSTAGNTPYVRGFALLYWTA